jgi:SAM-dependent methyltransferase
LSGRQPTTASAYDLIADRWLDRNFGTRDGMAQHARALAFLGDASAGWSLNVGCGCNTRFNPLLRGRGLSLEGIDVSARMLALARIADPGVVLYHADVCDWQPPRRYRFITAWDSLWHVRLDRQRALLLKLMAALELGGVFVFSAGGLDAPGEHTDNAMGPEVYYATLGIPGLMDVIREAHCICRHLEFDQYPQNHLVLIVQRAIAPFDTHVDP